MGKVIEYGMVTMLGVLGVLIIIAPIAREIGNIFEEAAFRLEQMGEY